MKKFLYQFGVDESGKLSDKTISDAVTRLAQEVPGLDEAAAEAQLATFRCHSLLRAYLAQAYEGLGLSIARVNTLRLLYLRNDRRMTMSQLSAYLEASLPSTMRLADALEAKGWLQRAPDQRDRRLTYVELTQSGEQLARELLPVISEVWTGIWRGFSESDRASLIALLSRIRLSLLDQVIGYESLLPFKMQARRRVRRSTGTRSSESAVAARPPAVEAAAWQAVPRPADPVVQHALERLREELPSFDESAVAAQLTFSRAFAVLAASLSSRYEAIGLSVPRFNTLQWLYHDQRGRVSCSELGAYLEASLPAVLRMARVLEEEGWVRRSGSESDRRVTFVELTPDGRERFAPLLRQAASIWSELWSSLSGEEKELLSHFMTRLRLQLLLR